MTAVTPSKGVTMKRLGIVCVVVGVLAASPAGHACQRNLAFGYVCHNMKGPLFHIPEASFAHELRRLSGVPLAGETRPKPVGDTRTAKRQSTARADRRDLYAALGETSLSQEEQASLLNRYDGIRDAMETHAEKNAGKPWFPSNTGATREKGGSAPPPEPTVFPMGTFGDLLTKLPKEFVLYAEGAALYGAMKYEEAVEVWSSLLALPESERQYRSTWASFMCGKAWLKADPAKAAPYFEQTRKLAHAGFVDSLDLATASLGWQGRAGIDSGDYYDSIRCYTLLLKTGTDEGIGIAAASLPIPCGRVVSTRSVDPRLINDPDCFNVMTLYALSRRDLYRRGSGSAVARSWLRAIVDAGVDPQQASAGRLAWLAYEGGKFTHAGKWAAQAGPSCPYGLWVQAKLAMRSGKSDDAVRIMRACVDALPDDESWRLIHGGDRIVNARKHARGQLGVFLLELEDYPGALEAFMRGGYREDAAYVAERIMTIDELEAFIKMHEGDTTFHVPASNSWHRGTLGMSALRHLCARRLIRMGEHERASAYFPSDKADGLKSAFDNLARALSEGRDSSLSRAHRADRLFFAAEIMRQWGMDLYGTEFLPDMAVWGGAYDWHAPARITKGNIPTEEAKRYRAHAPTPDKRFHYRYKAADLMWECAKLLPDNDPMTAKALYTGGMYIAKRDPEAADKFYKALVRRCRKLPIGQQADEARWFPKEPEF
ncbi:MAG: hypothetical protein GY851_32070 [bacterium]|nr:hypothetical protein [bacterium]